MFAEQARHIRFYTVVYRINQYLCMWVSTLVYFDTTKLVLANSEVFLVEFCNNMAIGLAYKMKPD